MSRIRPDFPRILLLCDHPPGDSGVGEIFLRELCSIYPQDKLAFGIIGAPQSDAKPLFDKVPRCNASWGTYEPSRSGGAVISMSRRHASFRIRALREHYHVYPRLREFAEQQHPEIVWAVLSSPTLFRIAPKIARSLDRPLVTTIWDPPEGIGHQFGLDRISRGVARRAFFDAIKRSQSCSVISERMHKEYSPFCDKRVILRHGIANAVQPDQHLLDTRELRIGFCGTLYAKDTWRLLLRALDRLSWKIAGRRVRLMVAGKSLPFIEAQEPAHVEFLGWRPMDEVIRAMSSCHFLYLPYWFDAAYAESVRLCFPTKLTTYLTAGRPTFYHGPGNTSVSDFFQKFSVGFACHNTATSLVASDLAEFGAKVIEGHPYEESIASAIAEELNLNTFRDRFYQLIGI